MSVLNLDMNKSKVLRPLKICSPVGAQPTLFQKRVALRHTNTHNNTRTSTNTSIAVGPSLLNHVAFMKRAPLVKPLIIPTSKGKGR